MFSIQIQTQNFTIIKTKNQINNLPSKIGMGMGMGMVSKNEWVWGLGWAGLGSACRRWRGCVCVCLRGRVRDREKMREFWVKTLCDCEKWNFCVGNEKNLGGNFFLTPLFFIFSFSPLNYPTSHIYILSSELEIAFG